MHAGALTAQPLSESDYDELEDWLDATSAFDLNGVLGVLHAVALAPGLIPPSVWLELVLSSGIEGASREQVEAFAGMLFRLHGEVLDAVSARQAIFPDAGDAAECESFAAGYAAAAALDPDWRGDAGRWSFAEPFAYLGGRFDLVSDETVAAIDENLAPDPKAILRRDLGSLIQATAESFENLRRPSSHTASPGPSRPSAKIGRNDQCPCGSGKKYKRCCIDAVPEPAP